jgi:hypothetical protein
VILQKLSGVVVVGGAGWGPLAKLYYRPTRQVEVGYLGAVAIKPIEVITEILLEAGQLHKLALVRRLLRTFKEVIVIMVRWLIWFPGPGK